LFRGGCPANGPCSYTLIDKNTEKTIDDFGQLICIDTEIEGNKKYQFDFLVYFSENYDKLKIYYVNSKKILTIPFSTKRNNLNAVTSEYQFTNMKVEGNILTLYYTRSDYKNSNLKINLKNKKYSL
jgi:hypothetical protein